MDNDFYKLFQEFKPHFDIGMSKDIQAFFCKRQEISKYDITLGHSVYVSIVLALEGVFLGMWAKVLLTYYI